MNTHGLKIGNYIEWQGGMAKIVSLRADTGIEVMLPGGNVMSKNTHEINPIELVSELLADSCLFDAEGRHLVGIDHHTYCLCLRDGYIILCNRSNEPVIHFWDVKYLHQLQNLYLALVGKEMEIVFSHSIF